MNTFVFTREAAAELHQSLTRDLEVVDAEYAELTKRKTGLENMLAGLRQLYPQVPPSDTVDAVPVTGRPKGLTSVEAVARVVEEEYDGRNYLPVQTVVAAMTQRKWAPVAANIEAAIRTALSRAVTQGLIERGKLDGRSSGYRPKDNSTPADTGAESQEVPTGAGGDLHAQVDQDHHHDSTRWDDQDRSGASVGN